MRFSLTPIYRDVLLTFLTEASIILMFLMVFHLLAVHYGPEVVGQFSLVKRNIRFLLPFLQFGLVLGIPRYISLSSEPSEKAVYILGGCLVVVLLTVVFIGMILSGKSFFAQVFLGGGLNQSLVFPLTLLLTGMVFHTLLYAILRGKLLVKWLNLLNFLNVGLVPLTLVYLFPRMSLEGLINIMGLATLSITLMLAIFLSRNFLVPIEWGIFLPRLKELVLFSFPRFLTCLLHASFYSLPVILAAHYLNISEVGYLSVSLSLLSAIGSAIAPLIVILLPKVGEMLAANREYAVRQNLKFLMGALIQSGLFVCVQMVIFCDVIIQYWLGPDFGEAVVVARLILLSILFYVLIGPISSFLEASRFKPYVMFNLMIGLAVLIMVTELLLFINWLRPLVSLSLGFVAGITANGVAMYISIRGIFPEQWQKDLQYLTVGILVNTLLASLTIFLRYILPAQLPVFLFLEIFIAVMYLVILWFLRVDWLRIFVGNLIVKPS